MKKDLFHLPKGIVYLDGNSLGPLPVNAVERVSDTMSNQWGEMLITAWNRAGWLDLASVLGDRVGRIIGAPSGSTVLGDTLSIKVYQAMAAALALKPDRKSVLSDTGNFPTDLYMVNGLFTSLNQGHSLKLVEPEQVLDSINSDLAAIILTHVDYRTGRMHDMEKISRAAHDAGAVMIWDLAHSAGAVPIDMSASGAEFAVGCTYKYLNGGPGAPAFISVRPDIIDQIEPALSGWFGHEAPFDFELDFRPAKGIERLRVGTPPVLQMKALEAALDIWDQVDMADIRKKSIELCELFIAEVERICPQFELASPRDASQRGSHVSFRFEHGYAVMQALIAAGVIGDFRAPNIMRFGFTPLYIDEHDVMLAVEKLANIMTGNKWDAPQFHQRQKVT
ncbi:MAG: kynureninase [Hyphomicrobiales bacterium]|nr:MAG: kynureninase [Hyphomicrobiales bacterium]